METERTDLTRPPLAAMVMGFGGLIPFVGLAVALRWGQASGNISTALIEYGALILSFIGALHWRIAVDAHAKGRDAWVQYGWSVVPALIAWSSFLLPTQVALRTQAAVFVVCLIVDHVLKGDMPMWLLRLRAALTSIVVVSLLVASA